MRRRIILIRHAETEGNKTRYVGREDLPLNAEGKRQATELDLALRGEMIGAVFSSPLTRAQATARPIAGRRGLELFLHSGLMEIDYGDLQGNMKGEKPFSLRREYLEAPMPGGESLRGVWARLETASADIRAALKEHACAAIVGHYWANRLLAALLCGGALEDALGKGGYRPGNASACAFDFRDGAFSESVWLHPAPGGVLREGPR
jgi:probable phosphoglycerate mutase